MGWESTLTIVSGGVAIVALVSAAILRVGPFALSVWKERQERARLLIDVRQDTQPRPRIYFLNDPPQDWNDDVDAALKIEIRNDGRRPIGLARPLRLVTTRPRRGAPRGVDLDSSGSYPDWPASGYIAPATMFVTWCTRQDWRTLRSGAAHSCIGVGIRDLSGRWHYHRLPDELRDWFNA